MRAMTAILIGCIASIRDNILNYFAVLQVECRIADAAARDKTILTIREVATALINSRVCNTNNLTITE
jgi:hypothetical protein